MENMTEEQAVSRLKKFVEGDCYVLLSSIRANMILGVSVPYVGEVEQGKLIVMFDSLEYAKQYIDDMGFEVLDGVYPIAKVNKDDMSSNIETIFNIAVKMEIYHLDINPGKEGDSLGVDIRFVQETLSMETGKVGIIVSEKEMEEIKNNPDGEVPIRFNGMPIIGFTNPFIISDERQKEIEGIPFNEAKTKDGYIDCLQKMSLNELCYLSEVLIRRYVPKAKQKQSKEEEKYFMSLFKILDQVVIHNTYKEKVYTLLDSEELFVNNGQAAYLIYTDRFKYMGEYRPQPIDIKKFVDKLDDMDIMYVFITCGPYHMHLTTTDAIREYLANNLY